MKLSDTDVAVHEVSILPPPPAAPVRGSIRVRSEAPPAGSAPVFRADEVEDMPTLQGTKDPGAQLSGGSAIPCRTRPRPQTGASGKASRTVGRANSRPMRARAKK